MKVLLVGINAKFIQTNLAIRLLTSYTNQYLTTQEKQSIQIDYAEWNINQCSDGILREIYKHKPNIVLFSVYVWNKIIVYQIIKNLKQILPNSVVGCGGPEVSWSAKKTFEENSDIDVIISGEGEVTFLELVKALNTKTSLEKVKGLYLNKNKTVVFTGNRELIENLDTIPFPYKDGFKKINPNHSIIYYESSRGCPFNCAYCLSSIERSVRYYSLERVFDDLKFFLDKKVPLVKFVDRTFNLDQKRYLKIWDFIKTNYNNVTTFHFEITAHLLTDEALEFLKTMPDASIQFEIGIQSINKKTLKIINRFNNINILEQKIKKIPQKIHTHVDLIAGLPEEDLESFAKSFDFAFSLGAGMVQLGFLKILSGTKMEALAKENQEYKWSDTPPYEVLKSPALSFEDLIILKEIDHLVDILYNSSLMVNCLKTLESAVGSAFEMFKNLAVFVKKHFADGDLFLPRKQVDLFAAMAEFLKNEDFAMNVQILEWLRYDFLLQGKPGAIPSWYARRYDKEKHEMALQKNNLLKKGVSRRIVYSKSEWDVFFFDENKTEVLFIYESKKRNTRVVFNEQ